MAGLVLRNVSKSFGPCKVLDNISLTLEAGELLVLLGPSGCGKTTLLRIIAGLEKADNGEIYLGDRRVDMLPARNRNTALVFQNYSLYPHMSVEKNLAFPLKVSGVAKRQRSKRVTFVAQMLGLSERLQDRPGRLSGGQRQRVALGRAIIREPSIFLLDEPLSNLDSDLRVKMRQEIVGIQRRLQCTMIHVTHDQTEALSMADRIALLHAGRIHQIGTPEDLYRQPSNRFVAEFLGQPRINFVEAILRDGYTVPFGIQWPPGIELSDFKVLVGIRPEAIALGDHGDFTAQVTACEYMGDHYDAMLLYQEHTLSVSDIQSPLKVGQTVRFSLKHNELLFFDAASGEKVVVQWR